MQPCYTTEINCKDNGFVEFMTQRPLDCNIDGSYVIELGKSLDLISAWNPDSSTFTFHGENFLIFQQIYNLDGTCTSEIDDGGGSSNLLYYVHGSFMWISWALIGLLQISLNRYCRAHWRWNKIAHAILGFIAAALVITAGFLALKHGGWKVKGASFHAKMGFSVFVLGLVLIVGGIVGNIIRLKVNMPWNSYRSLWIGKVHKYFGWFIVVLS